MSSNPITSVAPSSSPITSVSQTAPRPLAGQHHHNPAQFTRLNLELRGQLFPVDRETLMLLPESVLLGLFPQGLVLSKPATWEGGDDGVFAVDFDPECFSYILNFWSRAQLHFYGTPTTPGLFHAQKNIVEAPPTPTSPNTAAAAAAGGAESTQNPLLSKQAIIVLREELEYFSITTPGALASVDKNGMSNDELRAMKRACGRALEERRTIFAALQRNVNKENNMAEQHLIDMLCMSGFDRTDEWGYRACEPNRNIISSMALVLLKTGIHHPEAGTIDPTTGEAAVPTVDPGQMATAQKLLLFWRKPARKCWWDGIEVEVPESTASEKMMTVKVWARRVWTLELSLI